MERTSALSEIIIDIQRRPLADHVVWLGRSWDKKIICGNVLPVVNQAPPTFIDVGSYGFSVCSENATTTSDDTGQAVSTQNHTNTKRASSAHCIATDNANSLTKCSYQHNGKKRMTGLRCASDQRTERKVKRGGERRDWRSQHRRTILTTIKMTETKERANEDTRVDHEDGCSWSIPRRVERVNAETGGTVRGASTVSRTATRVGGAAA